MWEVVFQHPEYGEVSHPLTAFANACFRAAFIHNCHQDWLAPGTKPHIRRARRR